MESVKNLSCFYVIESVNGNGRSLFGPGTWSECVDLLQKLADENEIIPSVEQLTEGRFCGIFGYCVEIVGCQPITK